MYLKKKKEKKKFKKNIQDAQETSYDVSWMLSVI